MNKIFEIGAESMGIMAGLSLDEIARHINKKKYESLCVENPDVPLKELLELVYQGSKVIHDHVDSDNYEPISPDYEALDQADRAIRTIIDSEGFQEALYEMVRSIWKPEREYIEEEEADYRYAQLPKKARVL